VKSNIVYRFRPYRSDPGKCIAEVYFLSSWRKGEPRPKPAPVRWVAEDEHFADLPELGLLGPVFDQDVANLPYVQEGLRTLQLRKPGITLADYQESRIRHFHHTYDAWLNR